MMSMNECHEPAPADTAEDALRHIHTYVLRSGRMTEAQKRAYTIHSARWCIPFQNSIINFTDVFENVNPVVIEIGFGMGVATARIAEENPDKNYIGIEVHRPGVGRLLGEIERRGLLNVRIIECDAIRVLENMIPDGSVSAFHIFFPDPWPKKRHHKRRLMLGPRINLIAEKLAPSGCLFMATDWRSYAEEACAELSLSPSLENVYDGFAPRQQWRPETAFERKGRDAGREIYDVVFRKRRHETASPDGSRSGGGASAAAEGRPSLAEPARSAGVGCG